jgi:transmembrane sensor
MDDYSELNIAARADVLITKYLAGETNRAEETELENWLDQSEENKRYFVQLKHVWNSSERIALSEEEAFNKVKKQTKGMSVTIKLWKYWQKAAAILLIPLLAGGILFLRTETKEKIVSQAQMQTVTAPFGAFTSLNLPDGTKVWLNAGSKISFPQQFDPKSRKVDLVGEAYFEVVSNEKQPFFVNTPEISVRATGTKFNVRSFPGDPTPQVALAEGKVSVTPVDVKQGKKINLKPNQVLIYKKDKSSLNITNENVYKCYAWKDGKLVFRNDPFEEVARRISIQYNVDIELNGQKIKQYRYRATFNNETLDELLRLLKLSSPFSYRQVPSRHLPDGTYSRRKIIISTTE